MAQIQILMRRLRVPLFAACLAAAVASVWPIVASAHEGEPPPGGANVPVYLLQIGIFTLVAIAIIIPGLAVFLNYMRRHNIRPQGRLGGYLFQLSQFSRNARLFLLLGLSSWLGTSVWTVLFNLYLLSLGFDVKFIGLWLTINMLLHGLFAIPSGVLADRIGRRNTFLLANLLQVLSRAAALFVVDATPLLVLAAVIGFGDGAHAVAGAPFMVENSRPEERTHLFSLEASLTWVSRMLGSVLGGLLPVGAAMTLGLSIDDPAVGRIALLASLPIILAGLLPIYFISEKRSPPERRQTLGQFVRFSHLQSRGAILLLVLTTVFFGFGFGFTVPFLNVFFNQAYDATADQVGFILALGAWAAAIGSLFTPFVARRMGKVKGLFVTQLACFPFLIFLGAMPNLPLSVLLFFLWRSVWSFSNPLRNQFSMEIVSTRERATTNGLMHGALDLMAAPASYAAGLALATGNYVLSFGVAALAFAANAVLWLVFFSKTEKRGVLLAEVPLASPSSSRPQ